jgi:integrase
MATITKQNGKFKAQIRRKGMGSACRTFTTKKDAERWAVQTEAAMERGEYEAKPKAEAKPDKPKSDARGVTLGQLLERYRDNVSILNKGYKMESNRINTLLKEDIAKKQLSAVTAEDWAKLKDKRLKTVKQQTLKREFNSYSKMYKLAALEWGYSDLANPLENIKLSGKCKTRDRRLSQEEYEKVLAEARRRRNPLIAYIIEWAKESAMRRGEILAMKWNHINLKERVLTIPETKTDEARKIPITRALLAILEAQEVNRDRVFDIDVNNLHSTVRRVLKKVGLSDEFSFHLWRHEACSSLFEKGLNIPEVASISGHRNWAVMKRYTHVSPQAVLARLEGNHLELA